VIENGISITPVPKYDYQKLSKALRIPKDTFIILSVGSVRLQKNHSTAVKAISVLRKQTGRQIHYLICGGTNECDGFEAAHRTVTDVGGEEWVHFLGDQSDVTQFYYIADCYLSCSLFEGMPMAVLEALFSGLPCILSPIPVHHRLATFTDVCMVANTEDYDSYVEPLIKCISGSCNRKMLMEQRKQDLERFRIDVAATAYSAFYKDCLAADLKGNSNLVGSTT